jgi:hypothetical protein
VSGIVLALLAALGWGSADYLGGFASRATSAIAVLCVSQALGLGIAIVAAVIAGLPEPTTADLLAAFGAGASLLVGLGALYRGMSVGAMSIVSPIAAAGSAIPVLVGLAQGDRPSALQWAGVVATLSGVALISWQREERTGAGPRLAEGVALALLAALGGGLTATLIGAASSSGVLWLLLCQRATVAGLALVALATMGRAARVPRASLPAVCAIGVLDLGATAAFTAATAREALSLVAVVGALYPVVTVALAFALLSERLQAHQAVGAAAALAGVAAIAA